ncbi:MAG: MFS transporter, partial [Gammaproteobacteria bacterium]|nr:MFS transporter [Gammaproteobacteria bacterium]
GLVEYLGFDDKSAGYTASAEMFGIALTTVAMTFLSHRINWRHCLYGSLGLMTVANAACTFTTDPMVFVALRFAVGVGAGSVVSLGFAIVGLTANPDRNFGFLIMWVLSYGALGLLVMPSAYQLVGMDGVLWFFALFPAFAMLFVHLLPTNGEDVEIVEADALDLGRGMKACALAAMLCYFTAQGVVWAYLFLIGLDGGLGEQQVANGLTLSQFAGVAGALLAALLGNRFGRALPLTISIAGGAVCLYFLTGTFAFMVFAVFVSVYNFFWNVTHPYLLAAMASFDRHGRIVIYAVAMQMVGLAIGPGLAATVISEGEYGNVNITGAALFILSLLLILPPVITHTRDVHRAAARP